jgi:hypothetical protein
VVDLSDLVQMRFPSGQVVWARVDAEPQAGNTAWQVRDTARPESPGIWAVDGFPQTIAAVAESVLLGLDQLVPSEVSVEFGIELHAKTGKIISVLAEAGGSATVKVQLSWRDTNGERSASHEDPGNEAPCSNNPNDLGVGRGWLLVALRRCSTVISDSRVPAGDVAARCARAVPAPTAPELASFPCRAASPALWSSPSGRRRYRSRYSTLDETGHAWLSNQ